MGLTTAGLAAAVAPPSFLPRARRGELSTKMRSFLLFVVVVSLIVAIGRFAQHGPLDLPETARYGCYFVLAVFASSLKVRSRATHGVASMSFIFVIIALVDLNLKETVLISGSAIVFESLSLGSRKRKTADTLDALLSTLAAALIAQGLYRSQALRSFQLEPPVRLVLAVMGAFVAYNVPVAIAARLVEGFDRKRLLESLYLWSFPYHLVAATITALYSFICPFVTWYAPGLLLPMVYLIYCSYEQYVRRLERQRSHSSQVSDLHLRTIETLALAIEAKDQTTHDHLRRVQIYAIEIGKDLGLDENSLQALRAAAVLHDIGKLAVPEHILSKPGKLTREEFDKMKIHPVVGAEIVERARFPYPVAPIIRCHHERWDGGGYPDGLIGEAIPIGARILAAVDCLDALASDRQYRRALPLERALQEVASKAGKDFDPRVIRALVLRYREIEEMARSAAPIKPLIDPALQCGSHSAPCAPETDAAVPPPPFLRTIGAAREEVQKLFELSQQLGNSLELRETFAVLSRGLQPLVPYDAMALFFETPDGVVPQYLHGPDASLCNSMSLQSGGGISGWVMANAKAAVNCDPAREGGSMGALQCMISVPLTGRHGVVAALSLYSRKRSRYGGEHLRLLNAICPKLSLAVENGLTFQKAESSATTDYLTGLPNAHSLFLHLEREVDVSRYLSSGLGVLVCDLNGFKYINDTLGHLTGNRILQEVAKALRAGCRQYEYAARMGGDEFVIVCSGVQRKDLEARIPVLRSAIRAAGESVGGAGMLDSSFGSALFPDDGETVDELLAAADRRMYHDKAHMKTGANYVRKIEKGLKLNRQRRSEDRAETGLRNLQQAVQSESKASTGLIGESDSETSATCDRATSVSLRPPAPITGPVPLPTN